MPRRARVIYPGYVYHVTQRGNNRQFIFVENKDYSVYLKHVEAYAKNNFVDIYAYCLMGNHVHFILKLNNENGFETMFRGVNMRYAQYFQKKHKASGHVWQGRPHSCLLSDSHVRAAIRYVEVNPVKANMVKNAWDYPWSSARARFDKASQRLTLADINDILQVRDWKNYLSGKQDEAFVKNLCEMTKKNLILGSEDLIKKMEKLLGRTIMPNPEGRPFK